MSTTAGLRAAAVILAVAALISLAGVYAAPARPSAALSPPVVRESFTLLPCTGKPKERNTLEEEGCIEHQILATDAQINSTSRSIFALLLTTSSRRAFIAAQTAWLNYRRVDCASESDLYEGGTLAPVVDAACTVDRNGEREKDLRSFRRELQR